MLQGLRHNPRFLGSGALLLAILLFAVVGPLLPGHGNPFQNEGGVFTPPSFHLPLGTDNFGRGVLTELMFGTRNSLIIGVLAGAIAVVIGVVLGTLAGVTGGILEEGLMALTNIIIAIPALIVLILLSYALHSRSTFTMGLIIGVTSWPWTARAVRAQAASLRSREHVDIARLSGAGTVRLIALEIVPYMLSYVVMAFVLQLASAILTEAGLSLLGLGPSNNVSLGLMLHWALLFESVRTGAWWAFLPPTLMLTLIAFSLLMIQSSLDEVFNPRLRRSRPRRQAVAVGPVGTTVGVPEVEEA